MLVGGQASEGLKPFREVVGHQEGVDVRFELGVRTVMVALNRRLPERSVYPLNLTIGPRMVWLRQPLLELFASQSMSNIGSASVPSARDDSLADR